MRSLAVAAIAGCSVFPASNPWNQRVDERPVHANSDAIVRSIGLDGSVHPEFGSGRYEGRPIGIPYTVVSKTQKRSKVRFEYAAESDKGPYQARVVAKAPQQYGMLVADNGSDWYISGAPDSRWDNDDLHALGRLKGSDFEVVAQTG